jgi:hypothetical protein
MLQISGFQKFLGVRTQDPSLLLSKESSLSSEMSSIAHDQMDMVSCVSISSTGILSTVQRFRDGGGKTERERERQRQRQMQRMCRRLGVFLSPFVSPEICIFLQ